MDLTALRKPEALTLEETLPQLRDGLTDQGLRFLTALEPARAGSAPAILTVFVAAPLTGGVDLGPEALQAALRVVEATPYQGEPLPTPRPAAAIDPIAPGPAPSSSGPASAVDCTEGARRRPARWDDSGRELHVPLRCVPLWWPGGLKLPFGLRRIATVGAADAAPGQAVP